MTLRFTVRYNQLFRPLVNGHLFLEKDVAGFAFLCILKVYLNSLTTRKASIRQSLILTNVILSRHVVSLVGSLAGVCCQH